MDLLDLESATKVINDAAKEPVELSGSVSGTIEAFRYLRNLCGTNPDRQDDVIKMSNLLENSKRILIQIVTNNSSNEELVLCLRVGLQFLANLIVNNNSNQEVMWNSCQDLFDRCLRYDDSKVQNCSAMILYNIFLGRTDFLDELSHPCENLIKLTTKESTSEFPLFILELLVLKSNYIEKFYEHLNEEYRLIVLEIIQNLVTEQHNPNIKPEIIEFFSSQFIKKSDSILKVTGDYVEGLNPVETIKILDLLICFSSDDVQHYLQIVQKEVSLLINCIMLLRNVHELSKQHGNEFTMMNKISDLECEGQTSSVKDNPFFGFKCSLIRFIGNMCWKNSVNQTKVRELDCIPVLLDCCNIDGRNPFIVQWCILAIRNICEKNIDNQRFIASMSKEGKLDAARLKELGIVLNSEGDGDVLCIAPLKTDK